MVPAAIAIIMRGNQHRQCRCDRSGCSKPQPETGAFPESIDRVCYPYYNTTQSRVNAFENQAGLFPVRLLQFFTAERKDMLYE